MSLAKQVAAVETENETLKENLRRAQRAAGGNVVLRRRDGFERTMTLDVAPDYMGVGPFGCRYNWPRMIAQPSYQMPNFAVRSSEEFAMNSVCREERYILRNEQDAFGRQVYLEI
jgi:hypothetical protein